MSKRSQTTGQPKRRRRRSGASDANTPEVTQRKGGDYRKRAEREAELQKYLIRGSIIVGVIILALIVIAFVFDQVIVPGRVVATVNGESITVAEFRDQVRFERARLTQQLNSTVAQIQAAGLDPNQFLQQEPYQSWVNEVNFPDQLGRRVLDDMIEDRLIAQEAEKLNITTDEDVIQDEINEFFGYDPTQVALIGVDPTETPTPTITPTPFVSPTPTLIPTSTPTPEVEETAEATAEVTEDTTEDLPTPIASPTLSPEEVEENFETAIVNFRDFVRTQGGVSDSQVDAYFERQAIRELLQESVTETSETVPYYNTRHILVDTEEKALEVIDALNNGESFADLARAVSNDTGSGARGGELGWSPAANYVPEFGQAIREAEIGAIVGPVETQFGFHIIQVRAIEEREATEAELNSLRDNEFNQWLEDLKNSEETQTEIFDIWIDHVPRT